MIIFKVLEVIIIVMVFLFFVTQIIVPAIQGTAFLPMFRKESKLKQELVELEQTARENDLEKVVEEKKSAVNNQKGKSNDE